MNGRYVFTSSIGTFSIEATSESSVQLQHDGLPLGTYQGPEAAMAAVFRHKTGWRDWAALRGRVKAPRKLDWKHLCDAPVS